jgi:Peptidase family M1 domain/Omp85 superfamily domain
MLRLPLVCAYHRRGHIVWCWAMVWLAGLLVWPMAGRAATPEAFQEVHYQLEVTYDATARTIQGQVTFTAVWQDAEPLTGLYFFLPPNTLRRLDPREPAAFSDLRYARGFEAANLTVHWVTDGAQQQLPFRLQDDPAVPVGRVPDQAVLLVSLPRPYTAGERPSLTIAFTTRLPRAKNWGVYQEIMALDGLWYPMLVPHRRGAWVWGMQEFVHAHYALRLTTHAEQQVAASVPWTERTRRNGWQTLLGSAGPLYHLGLSSSARWHTEDDPAHTPALRVLVPPGDTFVAAHLLQTLRTVLAFYQQQFGFTLPTPVFTLVVHERDQSWPFGAVADNMLFLSRDLVRVPSIVHKLIEYFVARGVAQQWWGLHLAYNLNTERWIGEGLATYLALRWLDHQYGVDRNFLTWKSAWLPNFSYREQSVGITYRRLVVSEEEQPMNTPLDASKDSQGLRFIYEKKGALLYGMLHDLLGEPVFQDFLRVLALEGRGRLVTGTDVRQTAEAVSGRDLAWFFQQWVEQLVSLDYAVGQVEVIPQTDALGHTVYTNRVEIRRLGEAIMPLTVRLLATDGASYEMQVDGVARSNTMVWQHTAPLSDVHLDPDNRLPDVQRLNNASHVAYTVRPLIDFPRLDRYLLYPFVTLENNFIDGNIPRLHLIALYLDDQAASVSVGYKENPEELSLEGQLWRNRFPLPSMATSLAFSDRQSAYTLSLETSLLLEESHQQQRLSANLFTLGYRVAFLQQLEEFNGEAVPDDFATSTGRLHSFVLRYRRDTRIPPSAGAPLEVLAEPLAYGYALRLELELASELLGSTRPDFQQVRGEVSEYLRLWNQTWLQLRLFGGWSAGSIPLQRKLTLAGVDTVRGYPYRLRFLGDRMLGGTLGLRFPVLRDVRLEDPLRFFGLRSVHVAPFVDGGWVWDRHESLEDVSMRSSAGLRLIAGIGFGSWLRFEVAVDVAYPLDERGQHEDEGVQVWVRLQSTAGGGVR